MKSVGSSRLMRPSQCSVEPPTPFSRCDSKQVANTDRLERGIGIAIALDVLIGPSQAAEDLVVLQLRGALREVEARAGLDERDAAAATGRHGGEKAADESRTDDDEIVVPHLAHGYGAPGDSDSRQSPATPGHRV